VVAQEVKALAAQTARATRRSRSKSPTCRRLPKNRFGDQGDQLEIGRIFEIASIIAAAVEAQGDATEEIATSVQRAAQAHDSGRREYHRREPRRA